MRVEQPVPRITIDGLTVPGATDVEVESLGYFAADRFRIDFAIGAGHFTDARYFAALRAQTVFIEVALGAAGYVAILTAQIDNVRLDLLGNVATLCGRDLSARLIDAEIAEIFTNQSSSQIAETIARRHGLAANVAPTQTPVGQYYQLDHARSALAANARATTEWNMLVWLAQLENFGLSVTGTTLNFGPGGTAVQMFATPADFMTLTLDVATTLPTRTVVKSWNSRNKDVVTGTAGTAAGASATLIRPNLTASQAGSMAANHLATLGQHGTILTATMPGELTLTPNSKIVLSGTKSGLDQIYTIQAVRRTIGWRSGFTQAVRAWAYTG